MSSQEQGVEMGFTGERFPENTHLCLIFDNEKERREIVSKYLTAGLKKGELIRYFSDADDLENVRSWLQSMGVDVPNSTEDERFRVIRAADGYCPGGHFDPGKMIENMKAGYERARKAGYTGSRSTGEMTWVFRGIPGAERLMEYEAMIGAITSTFPHSGMCQYDARRFDGATLFKVLEVHPYMVAQGQIVRNPFYTRPEEIRESAAAG